MGQLKITLDLAGVTIETALINNLAPLAPKIAELAQDVAQFITSFVNSKNFDKVIAAVSEGLGNMAWFLENVDWKKIGGEMNWFAEKLGWLIPQSHHGASGSWDDGEFDGKNETPGDKLLDRVIPFLKTNSLSHLSFSRGILEKMGIPATFSNLAFLDKWQTKEGTAAGYNPLASTQKMPGSTAFNWNHGHPVQNYTSEDQGIDATIKTLNNGYYPDIVRAMRSGNPWGSKKVARELGIWGSGSDWYNGPSNAFRETFKHALAHALNEVDDDIRKHGKNWMHYIPKDVADLVAHAHLSAKEMVSTNIKEINRALVRGPQRRNGTNISVKVSVPTGHRVATSINGAVQH